MVAGLGDEELSVNGHKVVEPKNRVIRVMMRRQGSCKTLGENMIFMLNRASGLISLDALATTESSSITQRTLQKTIA